MFVCICRGIREDDLVRMARVRPLTGDLLIEVFDLRSADCCGRCAQRADSMAALANAAAVEAGAVLEGVPEEGDGDAGE